MLYSKQEQQQPPILPPPPQPEIYLPYGQINMINDFKGLWGEIVIWMRSYISAVAAGYSNVGAIADRLNSIPSNFQERLRLVFGRQPAEEFQNLLSKHILLTKTIIIAMKKRDPDAINTNTAALYKNADDMASLLRKINPFWSDIQWRNLLYSYIAMSLQESDAFFSNDFEKDIDTYDRLVSHSQLLGDYMANGIIQYLVVSRPAV